MCHAATGCGEGRLIAHLLTSCTPASLQRIIGMDISTDGLRRASTRLDRMVSGREPVLRELPLLQQGGDLGWQLPGQQGQHQAQSQQEQREKQDQQQTEQQDGWESCQQELPTMADTAGASCSDCSHAVHDNADDLSNRDQAGLRHTVHATAHQTGKHAGALAAPEASECVQHASVQASGNEQQQQGAAGQGLHGALPPAVAAATNISTTASSTTASSMPAGLMQTKQASVLEAGPEPGAQGWSAEVTLLHGSFAAPRLCQPDAWTTILSSKDTHSFAAGSRESSGCTNSRGPAAGEAAGSGSLLAAALVEVVEHLDPGPLALAAPALLGGLQPHLALVTTPNYEYNRVLHAAAAVAGVCSDKAPEPSHHTTPDAETARSAAVASTGRHAAGDACGERAAAQASVVSDGLCGASTANEGYAASMEQAVVAANAAYTGAAAAGRQRLRDSDHRFEWTRAGFRAWARGAAEAFGYDVSFHDVGHVLAEADVLGAQAWEGDRDVGAATQAAVFVRQPAPVCLSRPLLAWGPRRLARLGMSKEVNRDTT